ncbi:hypothetical protein FHY55_17550 [Oceanicola sp. D3]|uniref:hypothetical protein n=1 Tax=Oceanicola sp. D3 TaxID=2587163 RepID=UPI001121F462|nr:hypothetical protein [Oceanicola sp. D3]QDC10930.1 hypothetical protein FHY55_17550 [Oceanicola sp. D3]
MNKIERASAKAYIRKIFNIYIDEQNYEPSTLKQDFENQGAYLKRCLQEQIDKPLFTAEEFTNTYGHGDLTEDSLKGFIQALLDYVFNSGDFPDPDDFFY